MDFSTIVNQIAVLFLVLALGYLIKKLHIIDENANRKMSSFIVKVTGPLLIVSSMLKEINLTPSAMLNIFLLSIVVYFFLFLMTLIIPRLLRVPKDNMGVYKFMIMFSNVGFMGFPVVKAIFGDVGIVYASIFNIPFYILVYTLGIYFVSLNHVEKVKFKWIQMINPGVVAVFIGGFIFLNKLSLPIFLSDTIDMLGGLTTPLSMIVIGASLADIRIKNIFTNIRLYIYCTLKLFAFPLIMFFSLSFIGFEGLLLGVPVIITGMPVAANTVILSKEYGGDDALAAEGVFISTILFSGSILFLVYMLLSL